MSRFPHVFPVPYCAAFIALLAGCKGADTSPTPTVDVRVDHPGKTDASEATVPRTCLVDGRLGVAWQEDRTGAPGIFFNTSADNGATWLPGDVHINHADADAVAPDIACSGTYVYIVWEDERDGELKNHNIYAAVSTDGGQTFGETDVLLDGDVDGAAMSLGPRVVAVGDDVYVAWFDNRNGAYDIYLQASHDDGATWLPDAVRADSDPAGNAYSAWPSLAATKSGVIVAWEDSRGGASDIYASASTDGGQTFGNDVRLDTGDDSGATNSFEAHVAMESSTAVVTWYDERNGPRDIYLNTTTDVGATWTGSTAPTQVDSDGPGASDALHPSIALNSGKAYIAWQDDRSGGYDIYERTYDTAAGTFASPEVRLDTDANGESQSYYPQIAVDGRNVFVDWQDYRNDKDNVGFDDLFYNYSGDGGKNWNQSDLRINSNEQGSSYAIAASAGIVGGSFVAAWSDGREGTADIYSASRTLGDESVYVAPPAATK